MGADLTYAKMHGAWLGGAILSTSILEDADLTEASGVGATFDEVRAHSATFAYADLAGATFLRAWLDYTDFSGALCAI